MLEIDDRLFLNGFHDTTIYHNQLITGLHARDVKTVFGDVAGVIGALTCSGRLCRLVARERGIGRGAELGFSECEVADMSWLRLDEGSGEEGRRRVIDQIAVAENGQVGVVVTCWLPIFNFIALVYFLHFYSCPLMFSFHNPQIRIPQPQNPPNLHSPNPPPPNPT